MGHKVSPFAFRVGYIKTWKTTGFYNKNDYPKKASDDILVRNFVLTQLKGMPVGNLFLTHQDGEIKVLIYTSKVPLILGKGGEQVSNLEKLLSQKFNTKFSIEVKEIKKPEVSGNIVAFNIARQIEKRLPYRRVIKMAISKAMEKGAKGIKVIVGGRLNGAEIARSETYKEGNIPTQTIRSDIDYAIERADTIYGVIGIKVWIYKGDIFKK